MIRNFQLALLLNIAVVIYFCNAANIFCVFPMPLSSHQQPMLALSRALAAKGHNLTVITTNPSKVPIKNHREIDISYLHEEFHKLEQTGIKAERLDPFTMISYSVNVVKHFTTVIYNLPQIQNIIREVNGTKYDLFIYEPMFYGSLVAFADLIGNPPIIGLLTLDPPFAISEEVGNPSIPSYIPFKFSHLDDHMTFYERIYNLCISIHFYINNYYIRSFNEEMVKKHFGDLKYSVREMEFNKSLLILSTDSTTEYPKPYQPNTVFVGPMHISENPEPLPEDLQKWMDESEDGVIYFSLGSNMKGTSVPDKTRASFIKAFEQFPRIRVLWKWEADTKLPGQPDNVLVKKWLPQQSVLAHPKIRLFISQVGLQSFQEAIHYGVPILGVPVLADQDFNTRKLQSSGAGLGIEFHEINYELVYEKLKELLTNSSYKENMLRLSSITKDKPMSSVATAIWWVEYVLRHNGAPHLRPASLDLKWYQYYMLDILLVVIISLFTIPFLIYFIVYITCISRKQINKVKKN